LVSATFSPAPIKNRLEREYHGPSERDQEALSVLQERWNPYNTNRARLERNWSLNKAFILGNQWQTWDVGTWSYAPPSKSSRWKVREVRNLCRPWQERTISQMTDFDPIFKGKPRTRDLEDEKAARQSGKVSTAYWQELDMIAKMQMCAWWSTATGTGWLKTIFNPYAGKRIRGPKLRPHPQYPDEFMVARDRRGNIIMDDYHEGDIQTTVPSPYTLFWDQAATEDEDRFWMMEVCRRPLQWVDQYFPEKSAFVRADQEVNDPKTKSRSLFFQSGLFGSSHDGWTDKEWTTTKEYYEKPSPKFPEGRLIVSAGNVILTNDDNPTPDAGFPYTDLKRLLVGDSPYGDTELTDLRTINKNYNRLRSKRLEHVYLLGANAKVMIPNQVGTPTSQWVSSIGEVIKFSGPMFPQYLVPPPLPAESQQEMDAAKQDLDTVGNTYGPERGQYQGKLSGTALELLVEQAFKAKKPTTFRVRRAILHWAKLVLGNVQKYMAEDDRMLSICGRDEQFDLVAFNGADLRGHTDLTIELDAMMPRSRALAMQSIQLMAQSGMLNMMDPRDKQRAFKMLDQESPDEVIYDSNAHRRRAEEENYRMLRGEMVDPMPHEDHDVHVLTHRAQMTTDEFYAAPEEIQHILIKHYQKTLEMAMPQTGVTLPPEQQAQIQAAAGGPPQSQGGSQ